MLYWGRICAIKLVKDAAGFGVERLQMVSRVFARCFIFCTKYRSIQRNTINTTNIWHSHRSTFWRVLFFVSLKKISHRPKSMAFWAVEDQTQQKHSNVDPESGSRWLPKFNRGFHEQR